MDLVQRLKLILSISIASMRRPAKFGRNRSSRAGDIQDFSKIQDGGRAAILHLVQRLKLNRNISIASVRRLTKFGRNQSSVLEIFKI